MVTQPLPYPGKRDLRAAVADREADAEAQRLDAAKLNLVARVKEAYYRLAYTYAADDVLVRNRTLLDTLLRVSEGRYGVGRAAQQDVFKAQTELSVVELQLERVRQERASREAELNALTGSAPGTPVGRPDDLALVPFAPAVDALLSAAAANAPALKADTAMVASAQAALDVARREYQPDFAVTGGYYAMGSMPSMYMFRFDVNVPLQRERRAAAVGERTSSLAQARSTVDTTRLDIQSRVQQEYHAATTALRLASLYRDTVLPQVRLALESSMASYQTGAVEFLSVLTNAGSALQYEMTYYDELAAFHASASRLEEMTGTPMVH